MKRRIAITFALALCLLACGTEKGDPVPLVTDETQEGGGCWLLHVVVDVVADPATGTPSVKDSGAALQWPRGYSARRAGNEVEVLDAAGSVVLTTGGRYWMCPTPRSDYSAPLSTWVLGEVRPCPGCELGGGPD